MILRKIVIITAVLAANLISAQRSKEELQQQNAELKRQIAAINSNLAKAKNEAKLSIFYLNNINRKIALREKVYRNTQKEKRFLEDEIYLRQLEINKYNRELKVLRKDYAQVLVNAYKNKGVQNKVTFILSSKNLGEALRRVQYLKKYGEYQDKKAAEITDKANQIKKTIALREKSKKDKEVLLVRQGSELETINQERKEKEILLEDFKKNEAKLVAELKQKQAESKRLEGEIRKIIAEEIRIAKAKEEAERKAREEAERAKRKAEEEERKLAEIARKKAEEERKAIEANNEAKRIAAEKARIEAAEKAKIAASKAEAARANSEAVAKKTESEKKVVDEKVMSTFGPGSATGNSFVANRGKMSFPVSKGQVTHLFGKRPDPRYKNVIVENNGIKIAVDAGTKARSVFAGVVVNVLSSGGAKTVMVKHGDYFTIYGNLVSTNVSKNQNISAGATIGEVGLDFDGTHTLDFQIWERTTPVDPLGWISR